MVKKRKGRRGKKKKRDERKKLIPFVHFPKI